MPKLTAAKINAVATIVITGVTAGTKVWKALNEDETVSEKVKSLAGRVRDAASSPDPGDRLEQQLRVIAEAIAALPADHPRRADWQSRVDTLRRKIPLAVAQSGKARRASLKALRERSSALLAEVLGDGIDPGPAVPQGPSGSSRRSALRGRLRRSGRGGTDATDHPAESESA